jgi:hypothetical protein
MAEERVSEEKKDRLIKPEKNDRPQSHGDGSGSEGRISKLQKTVGNRAVQRLLVQLKGEGSYELDEETTARINSERDSGQPLDGAVSEKMGTALGADFSDVRVHTSPEAGDLSSQLSARAFTTGKDIFFGKGEYTPGSSSGQELLAHELTHVVQQGSGAVGGANRMTVNPPGDRFEQEANAVEKSALTPTAIEGGSLQRLGDSQEEEPEAMQKKEGEDYLKPETAGIQRAAPEEEEKLQTKDESIQRIEQEREEEKVILKPDLERIQRQEEEEVQEKAQRQELPEEKKEEEEV